MCRVTSEENITEENENNHIYIAREIVLLNGSYDSIKFLLSFSRIWPYPVIILNHSISIDINASKIIGNLTIIQSIPKVNVHSYIINIPINGIYDLFIYDSIYNDTIIYKVFIDNFQIIATSIIGKDFEWIKLGSYNLSSGQHKITVEKINLLDNNSINSLVMSNIMISINYPSYIPDSQDLNKTQLHFKYISSSFYLVRTSLKDPFILVFAESFSKNWKIYYGKQNWLSIFLSQPIPDGYHYQVNGYANGWYIVPNNNFDGIFTIYFWPQSLFYLGIVISFSSIIFCIIYVLYGLLSKSV